MKSLMFNSFFPPNSKVWGSLLEKGNALGWMGGSRMGGTRVGAGGPQSRINGTRIEARKWHADGRAGGPAEPRRSWGFVELGAHRSITRASELGGTRIGARMHGKRIEGGVRGRVARRQPPTQTLGLDTQTAGPDTQTARDLTKKVLGEGPRPRHRERRQYRAPTHKPPGRGPTQKCRERTAGPRRRPRQRAPQPGPDTKSAEERRAPTQKPPGPDTESVVEDWPAPLTESAGA